MVFLKKTLIFRCPQPKLSYGQRSKCADLLKVTLILLHKTVRRAGIRLVIGIQIQRTRKSCELRHDIVKLRDLSVKAIRISKLHRDVPHHKLRLIVAVIVDLVHLDIADIQHLGQV